MWYIVLFQKAYKHPPMPVSRRNIMESIINSLVSNPFGAMATIFQLLAIFLGGPSQVWKLYKEKNVSAFSLPMFLFPALSSANWIMNAWKETPNQFLLFSQVPAAIVSTVIVGQYLYYKYGRTAPTTATSCAK